MKFLFRFVFFGLLFYSISLHFPEAFERLVFWAEICTDGLHQCIDYGLHYYQNIHSV